MKQPWLKFYPTDWRADPSLRMCSIAARGLWMEMVCIMHEAERRGCLLINGHKVDGKQLAALAGSSLKETLLLLGELAAAGVFSREDNGTIYSRRMRREAEKAERDKANGRLGGNPALIHGVNPQVNGEDKAYMLEARNQNPEEKEIAAIAAPKPKRAVKSFLEDDWEPFGSYTDRQAIELAKMRDWAKSNAVRKADWPATWRNWLRKAGVPEDPPGDIKTSGAPIQIHEGTEEMEAWDRHWRQTKGVNAPRSKHGGIFVDTQWPPGGEHERGTDRETAPQQAVLRAGSRSYEAN